MALNIKDLESKHLLLMIYIVTTTVYKLLMILLTLLRPLFKQLLYILLTWAQ